MREITNLQKFCQFDILAEKTGTLAKVIVTVPDVAKVPAVADTTATQTATLLSSSSTL